MLENADNSVGDDVGLHPKVDEAWEFSFQRSIFASIYNFAHVAAGLPGLLGSGENFAYYFVTSFTWTKRLQFSVSSTRN